MKNIIYILVVLFAFIYPGLADTNSDKSFETASTFLNYLKSNNGKGMHDMFSATVKEKISLEQTSLIWSQITSMFGEFQSQGEILKSEYKDLSIFSCTFIFERGLLDAKITVDNDGKIAGFFITPKQEESKYILPDYADSTKFVETALKFGTDDYPLNSVLTLPKSETKTAVVILVHGSGPHDMDETIGPNKPFKDLAWGLASNNVAVFRYNKRTKQYPDKMIQVFEDADVYDEVIDDAVYAVNFIMNNAEYFNIDKNKIYVLGHSLGGTLLPRIAQKSKDIAGLISMAGMTRKIQDVLLEQYNYLFSLDGELSDDEKKQISELKQHISNMTSPNLSKSTPADSLPLNMPAKYWMTFRQVDPANEIKDFGGRILILQGLRDYQVTQQDFDIWKNALKGNKNAELISYPDLNHLMQKGTGMSKPDEYYVPSKVDNKVINDISNWIKK